MNDSKGQLRVLGDLFDFWTTNLSAAVLAYRELIDRLAALGATWVVGNHDNALAGFRDKCLMPNHVLFLRSRPAFQEFINGKRFAFLHGHEADPYCRDLNPGIGEITAIVSGLLEDRNKGPVHNGHPVEDEFVGTLEAALTLWVRLTGRHGRLAEMIDNVEKYRAEQKADVVVSGHTHAPGRIGDYHFNCGSWCRDRDTFVRIEDDGTAEVFEWLGDHAISFEKALRS